MRGYLFAKRFSRSADRAFTEDSEILGVDVDGDGCGGCEEEVFLVWV